MSSTVLETSNLTRAFGGEEVLRDVTFELNEGSLTALLGPNGAGKTTLLRMLSTLLRPTSGSFSVCGFSHTDPAKIRARIGVLPESNGYYSSWTAREYLAYFARLSGHRPSEARALSADLLHDFGLSDAMDVPLKVFSRGMQQRLGLAKTLVSDPAVVFLDEPTLGLDPAGQVTLEEYIRSMAEDCDAAVLLSTHDLEEAESTCDEILILNDGKLVSDGRTPSEVERSDVERTLRFRVPVDAVSSARRVFDDYGPAKDVAVERKAGVSEIRVRVVDANEATTDTESSSNRVIRRLIEADVPLLHFEVEKTQLRDTFFELTEH